MQGPAIQNNQTVKFKIMKKYILDYNHSWLVLITLCSRFLSLSNYNVNQGKVDHGNHREQIDSWENKLQLRFNLRAQILFLDDIYAYTHHCNILVLKLIQYMI